jgi:putative transposase
VHGYALLDNEVQLLVTPASAEGLSRAMQALARRHGARFNQRHRHTGTLWSGRFRASVVDPDRWVAICLRYIETAHIRAGAPDSQRRWSSAPHHLGMRRDPLVHEHAAYWSLGNTPFDREAAWATLLECPLAPRETAAVEAALRSGWPLGGEPFRTELARRIVRRLTPLPAGRPRA